MSKSKKTEEIIKDEEFPYPTDSIIVLFNSITQSKIIIEELKKNKVYIVNKIKISLNPDQINQFMSNDPETWNNIDQLNKVIQTVTTSKNKPNTNNPGNKAKQNTAQNQEQIIELICPPFFSEYIIKLVIEKQ